LRHRFVKEMLILERNLFVSEIWQKRHSSVALETCTKPPAMAIYEAMYSPHVVPLGRLKKTNSLSEHVAGALERAVPTKPSTKYVKGLTRYMKVQKPGICVGLARIPQNVNIMTVRIPTIPPATSALSIPAMMRCAKVLENKKKTQIKRKTKTPRECSASVYRALRYRPIGKYQKKKLKRENTYIVLAADRNNLRMPVYRVPEGFNKHVCTDEGHP
jgi:hypothetical protein